MVVVYAGDGENGGDARVANGLYDVRKGQEGECEETVLVMMSDTMQWLYWDCAAWCCDPVRPPFWPWAELLLPFLVRAACCLLLLSLTHTRIATSQTRGTIPNASCSADVRNHTEKRETSRRPRTARVRA